MLPKINLEHLELLRPWGPQIQLPARRPQVRVHDANFNTQCYKDAIDLTSRGKVHFKQTFFQNEAQKVLYKPVLISDLISHFM